MQSELTIMQKSNPNRKLEHSEVREIRRLYWSDRNIKYKHLAKKFKVSIGCINKVITKTTWGWLE